MKSNQNQFMLSIIQSIQIEVDDFTQRVADKECYELMIYRWAIRLFEKGISSSQAITIIHRARRYVLIHQKNNLNYTSPVRIVNSKSNWQNNPMLQGKVIEILAHNMLTDYKNKKGDVQSKNKKTSSFMLLIDNIKNRVRTWTPIKKYI